MNKAIFLVLGYIILFSACGKQVSEQASTTVGLQAQLGQARHFDVPVPLFFAAVNQSSQKQKNGYLDFAKYLGSSPVKDVLSFYKREMERNGWDITDLSSNNEVFLFCNKPTKVCGIVAQAINTIPKEQKTTLLVFISQKS